MCQDSVVGMATCYGLDGPGIEFRFGGGEIFTTGPDRSGAEPGSCTMDTGHFTCLYMPVNYAYPKNRIRDVLCVSNSTFKLRTNLYVIN